MGVGGGGGFLFIYFFFKKKKIGTERGRGDSKEIFIEGWVWVGG